MASTSARAPELRDAAHTKKLFLRDRKGCRNWLVVTRCSKVVDLRVLAARISADNLNVGAARRFATHLQITPGAVIALTLVADPRHEVEEEVDAGVWRHDTLCCHPLVNTSTLVLSREALQCFFDPLIVSVPARV